MTTFGLHLTSFPSEGPDLVAYLAEVGIPLDTTAVFSTLWLGDQVQNLGPEGAEQVQPLLDAGIDHLIVELAGGAGAKSIALAADALRGLR